MQSPHVQAYGRLHMSSQWQTQDQSYDWCTCIRGEAEQQETKAAI